MLKIAVTGASGLLGLNLSLLEGSGVEITGIDRSKLERTPFELLRADLLEHGVIEHLLDTIKPDAVLHTAANANVDACEVDPAGARRLNADLPGELAVACSKRGIRLMHISTDAVFDGSLDGIYTEADLPNPLGVYAHTKLDAEKNVLSTDSHAIVARVNFFGWSLDGTRSLPEYFLNKLTANQPCNGFSDVIFCPMFVGDLARTLRLMLEKELSGLYHVVGSEAITKFEFGQRIARQFGCDPALVIPRSVDDSGLKARRSPNLHLSIHKLSTALHQDIPSFSTGITEFYTQAQQGYPQKMRSYQQIS